MNAGARNGMKTLKKSVKYFISELNPELEKVINAKVCQYVIINKYVILGRSETNKETLKLILKDFINNTTK